MVLMTTIPYLKQTQMNSKEEEKNLFLLLYYCIDLKILGVYMVVRCSLNFQTGLRLNDYRNFWSETECFLHYEWLQVYGE